MSIKFKPGLIILFCFAVMAFSGCEAGLSQNDSNGSGDGNFSFSEIYSNINSMKEEIENLKNTISAQNEVIAGLTGGSAISISSLDESIKNLEDYVGNLAPGTAGTLAFRTNSLEENISTVSISDLNAVTTRLNAAFPEANVSKNGSTIQFSSVNVQIVNGSGSTTGTVNGLGNLIVGYNESRGSCSNDCGSSCYFCYNDRSGSHNIVTGANNNYTSYGGFVAGLNNNLTGAYASVSGGRFNAAEEWCSSVSAGLYNRARGAYAGLSGGRYNLAKGEYSSVSGGWYNSAIGDYSSISGGRENKATGDVASVSAGYLNEAAGLRSGVSGGQSNTANGDNASITGGTLNTTHTGIGAVVSGGYNSTATGNYSVLSGGHAKLISDDYGWRAWDLVYK
ncbi:MAG: hypothetical protein GY754_01355 [bacterium]|nr:hypothetical protein [bacterium]